MHLIFNFKIPLLCLFATLQAQLWSLFESVALEFFGILYLNYLKFINNFYLGIISSYHLCTRYLFVVEDHQACRESTISIEWTSHQPITITQ